MAIRVGEIMECLLELSLSEHQVLRPDAVLYTVLSIRGSKPPVCHREAVTNSLSHCLQQALIGQRHNRSPRLRLSALSG